MDLSFFLLVDGCCMIIFWKHIYMMMFFHACFYDYVLYDDDSYYVYLPRYFVVDIDDVSLRCVYFKFCIFHNMMMF